MSEADGRKEIRNRIVEIVEVDSSELQDNEGNWRRHDAMQKNAMRGILEEIGKVAPLLAYRSERAGGALVLLDGHLRKGEFGGTWHVAIADLTDDEADKMLLAYDPVGAIATADARAFQDLRGRVDFDDASVRMMLDDAVRQESTEVVEAEVAGDTGEPDPVPRMELMPHEHYDYVLVVARTTMEWNFLTEKLGLKRVDGSPDERHPKVGLGRAIPAERLVALLSD